MNELDILGYKILPLVYELSVSNDNRTYIKIVVNDELVNRSISIYYSKDDKLCNNQNGASCVVNIGFETYQCDEISMCDAVIKHMNSMIDSRMIISEQNLACIKYAEQYINNHKMRKYTGFHDISIKTE
jgi:hypothetical protein